MALLIIEEMIEEKVAAGLEQCTRGVSVGTVQKECVCGYLGEGGGGGGQPRLYQVIGLWLEAPWLPLQHGLPPGCS